jgi:large subunit ribosomal protein L9
MATCEVLLLEQINNLGDEGECVRVRAGYARNFLVPRRKAVAFNNATEKQIKALIKRRDERKRIELEKAKNIAEELKGLRIVVAVRTGENGKLFGSVSATDLLGKLAENGITIDRGQLQLQHPLKALGQHNVDVRIHCDVCATFIVEIVSENPVISDAD